MLVLALVLALGSWAWAAAPAGAITGGREADRQYGQVQFYVTSGEGDPGSYACAGTLISPNWVLTAKHCIEDPGANENNSFVLTGDKRLGYGAAHSIKKIHLEPNTDSALLELEDASSAEVVGYSANELELNSLVDIAGWGSEGSDPPSPTLQVATMLNIDTQWSGAEVGDRLLFEDTGQGRPQEGDSGAGVHPLGKGVIYGVLSGNSDYDDGTYEGASAVPTNDIARWIEATSGVAPSDPSLEGWDSPSVQDADKNVKDLVSTLAEENPGYDVMVIQQETYSGPTDISGVKYSSTVDFGTNTFDVWVFKSGSFTNEGDMGWDNWGWSGSNWTRSEDQRTVTFEPIA